jgi:hypothetical protein
VFRKSTFDHYQRFTRVQHSQNYVLVFRRRNSGWKMEATCRDIKNKTNKKLQINIKGVISSRYDVLIITKSAFFLLENWKIPQNHFGWKIKFDKISPFFCWKDRRFNKIIVASKRKPKIKCLYFIDQSSKHHFTSKRIRSKEKIISFSYL